jgi:hypothetical protein
MLSLSRKYEDIHQGNYQFLSNCHHFTRPFAVRLTFTTLYDILFGS